MKKLLCALLIVCQLVLPASALAAEGFEVCFEDFDGSPLLPEPYYQLIPTGESAVAPDDPQREGYRFTGWDADFSNVQSDLTVTALYEPLSSCTLTVTYRLFDGSCAAQPYVAVTPKGEPFFSSVESPAVLGYKFRDEALATVVFDETSVDADKEVIVWYDPADSVKYAVEYRLEKLGGGYDVSAEAGYEAFAPTGSTVTAEEKSIEGFTAPAVMPSSPVAANGSTVLAALYTRNAYTVFYETGAGPLSPEVYYFEETTAPPAEPTRAGYDFDGWYEDEERTVPHSFGAMPARDVHLFAKWRTAQSSYTVVYLLESDDGSGYDYAESERKTAVTESAVAPSNYGKSFDGFHYSADNSDAVTVSGDGGTVQYIRFLRKTVTITFMTRQSGRYAPAGSFTGKYGEDILDRWLSTSPAKDYTRWSERQDGSSPWYSAIDELPANDLTLYAVADGSRLWEIYYYLEALPGAAGTINHGGKRYAEKAGTPIKIYYNGRELYITENEDCYPIDGFSFDEYDDFGSDRKAQIYYNRNSYRIDFLLNGAAGAPPAPITALYEAALTPPDDPTPPEGYVFGGWYTTKEGYEGSEFDFDGAVMPAVNLILYAKWTPKTYTVSFDLNGANGEIEPITGVARGSKIELPDDPERRGFDFVCWTLNEKIFSPDSVITDNVVLKAKWTPRNDLEYTVSFVLKDDPDTKLCEPLREGGCRAGDTAFAAALAFEGYLPDCRSKSCVISGEQDAELVFYYTPFTEADYTVRYLDSEGTALLDEKRAVTQESVVTENYRLVSGFYPDAYQKSLALTTEPSDNVLTFVYAANPESSYAVRHYKQNVSGVGYTLEDEETLSAPVGSSVTAPIKSYTSFEYNDALSSRSGLIASGNSTVFRLYYDRERFDVTFAAAANGSLSGEDEFLDIPYETPWGTAVEVPSPAADRGYKFDEWRASDPNAIAADYKIVSDMNFTAHFERDDAQWHTVTYNANGGEGAMEPDTDILTGTDHQLKPNAFTLADHDFAGWAEEPIGSIVYSDEGIIENIDSDREIFAVYTPRPRATITYFPNGGTGSARTDTPTVGSRYTILANTVTGFARDGYSFDGWNTRSDGDGASFSAGDEIAARNLNLYAQWSINPEDWVTVTFYKNNPAATGTMTPLTVLKNTAAALPQNGFSLEHHEFLGWATAPAGSVVYADGATTAPLASGLALYAVWREDVSYAVIYNGNGSTSGSTVDPDSPYYGGDVTVLANGFLRTGTVFLGWSETALPLVNTQTQADALTLILPGSEIIDISRDYVFYAVWARENYDKYTVTYFGNGNSGGSVPVDMNYYALGSSVTVQGKGDLTRSGYHFAGWLDNNGTLVQPGNAVTVTGNMTFTAQWSRIETNIPLTSANLPDKENPDLIAPLALLLLALPAAPLLLRRRKKS